MASPQGETQETPEITILFDRSVRALQAPAQTPPQIRLEPPVDGGWDWVGSRALRFLPVTGLPEATSFRVTVPAGVQALDGSKLAEDYVFEFSSPRPLLVRTFPSKNDKNVDRNSHISLYFNQPISESEILRALRLVGQKGARSIPFSVERQPSGSFLLIPKEKLPAEDTVELEVDPSLRGVHGNLTAGTQSHITFRTRGTLRLQDLGCWVGRELKPFCPPQEPVTLRFSTSVLPSAVQKSLHLTPSVPFSVQGSYWEGDYRTETLLLMAPLSAGKTYTLSLDANLVDQDGQRLVAERPRSLQIDDGTPQVWFSDTGTYWGARKKHQTTVRALNVRSAQVSAARLTPEQALSAFLDETHSTTTIDSAPGVPIPLGAYNEETSLGVSLDSLVGQPDVRGAVLLRAAWKGEALSRQTDWLVQVTQLGISAESLSGGTLLWVSDIDTGAPIPEAAVQVRVAGASATQQRRTDASGVAFVPEQTANPLTPHAALAQLDSDWAVAKLPLRPATRAAGQIFTDRGIYRPGETVHLKGIFRVPTLEGLSTPAHHPVHLSVRDPDWKNIRSWVQTLSDFGTLAEEVHLPQESAVGDFHLEVEFEGRKFRHDFQVAEYRGSEFEVVASVDRKEYVRGDTLVCSGRGRYRQGGPLAGAKSELRLRRRTIAFSSPGTEGFSFEDSQSLADRGWGGGEIKKADVEGRVSHAFPLNWPEQRGLELVSCTVEIDDLNRQENWAAASATVYPGEFLVGLQTPAETLAKPGNTLRPQVLVVDPNGNRRPQAVHLTLAQRQWFPPKTADDTERVEDRVLSECDVLAGAKPASCALSVPSQAYGERDRLIVRAAAKDPRGNRVASSYSLIPEGPKDKRLAPVPPQPTEGERPPLVLTLAPDQLSVGDTAHLRLDTTFPAAQGLVAVTREGLLWHQALAFTGPTTQVDIPISASMIPGGRVAVVLVAKGKTQYESTSLHVDPSPRSLTVLLTTSASQLGPGEPVEATVTVRDAAGKPQRAEVTLFAADEASLAITRYETPAPTDAIYGSHWWDSSHFESREDLLRPLAISLPKGQAPQVRLGGTSSPRYRADFRQTVLFEPRLVTDASGQVHRKVRLPDGLTSYRFMAVAVAPDDRFGSAEARVVTTKPLLIRPALPRVVRAGDRFEVSAVISAEAQARTKVQVSALAEGLVPTGDTQRVVELEAGFPAEVRFPFQATQVGPIKVSLQAQRLGSNDSDAVELKAKVTSPALLETVALYGSTTELAAERLGDLSALRPDVGELDIYLASTALAGLRGGLEQLLEYPHGCTEQLVSRLVPLLSLQSLTEGLGLAVAAEVPPLARSVVQRLANHQRRDGGFGFWEESSESRPWLTAYALWGLKEASLHGIEVPPAATTRAIEYLKKRMRATGEEGLDLAERAFVLDLLASTGAADQEDVRPLLDRRDELPLSAKALLLHALAQEGREREARDVLTRELESTLRMDGPLVRVRPEPRSTASWLLDSPLRTQALILRAFLAAAPGHPLLGALARGLLAEQREGHWRTTQETAWALRALEAYQRAREQVPADFRARLFVGSSLLTEADFQHDNALLPLSVRRRIPLSVLSRASGENLLLQVLGKGELHYEARLRFARKEFPTPAVGAGFFVERQAFVVGRSGRVIREKEQFATATVAASDLVRCQVIVANPMPRTAIVIEDPVPGGLEAEAIPKGAHFSDYRLRADRVTRREIREDRVLFYVDDLPAGIHRFEYYARATTCGTFLQPSARATEMYSPETYGTSPGRLFTVVGEPQ